VLTNFLRSPGGGRVVVEGEPGVGKTTFVNFHRHQWRKELLSPATEISVQENWTERDFLLSLLNSLLSRLRLDMGSKEFKSDVLLQEVTAITGVRVEQTSGFSANVTVIGTGGGFWQNLILSVKVGELTNGRLRSICPAWLRGPEKSGAAPGSSFIWKTWSCSFVTADGSLRRFFEAIRRRTNRSQPLDTQLSCRLPQSVVDLLSDLLPSSILLNCCQPCCQSAVWPETKKPATRLRSGPLEIWRPHGDSNLAGPTT